MLYDPKWEQKTDFFSIEGLISWLEKQNPNAVYCYTSNGECLMAKYLIDAGDEDVSIGGWGKFRTKTRSGKFPASFWRVAAIGEWTFGAALERARNPM